MKWLISEAWQFQLFWCNDLGYIACWWKVLQVVAWKRAVYLNVYFLIVIPLNIIQSDIFPLVTLLPHRTRWSPIHLTVTYCELFLFFYCLGGPSDQTCPALVTLENGKVEPKRHTWFLLWCFVFVSLRLLFWVMVSVVSVQLYVFSCICSVVCVQLYVFSCICSVVSVQLYLFSCICSGSSGTTPWQTGWPPAGMFPWLRLAVSPLSPRWKLGQTGWCHEVGHTSKSCLIWSYPDQLMGNFLSPELICTSVALG